MSQVLDAFTRSVAAATAVEMWGDGELVVTPFGLRDGEPVVVYVKQVDGDTFYVTDRGQASDSLMIGGLDFGRPQVNNSWNAVRESVEQAMLIPEPLSEWELATYASSETLGYAISHVAEAALRADGLRALAAPRAPRLLFSDWVIAEAGKRGLTVHPNAVIPSAGAIRRKVSTKVSGAKTAYINAIGPKAEPWGAFDHARSLFADSNVNSNERVTLVAHGSRLDRDQLDAIKIHSRVFEEGGYSYLLDELAA